MCNMTENLQVYDVQSLLTCFVRCCLKKDEENKMTYTQLYKTPIKFSDIILKSDGEYLTGLWFVGSRDSNKHTANSIEKELKIFTQTAKWLDMYFSGKAPDFIPQYRIENLTPFRKEVIDIMLSIPYGKTVTYGEIANKIAKNHAVKKMSAQAVGGAVGWNPICLIIPCHRVIGANGSLTGYGGGIKNKISLLESEGHDMSKFIIPVKGTAL